MGRRRVALDGQRRGRAGSAGSAIVEQQLDDLTPLTRAAGRGAARKASRTRCCSAWAAPASAPRSGRRRSAGRRAGPSCSSSIRPTPRRCRRSRTRSTSRKTLFIVSSKSGSTLEPNIFKAVLLRAGEAGGGRGRGGQPLRGRHRPGLEPREGGDGRRLPPRLPRGEEHRRPLLGAVELRHGARPRSWASTWSGCWTRPSGCCTPVRPACPPTRTRASCWARSWASPASKGIDKLTLVASPGISRPRRVARAADRRVHRQGGQGDHPRRPRARRGARRLRRRPPVRLPAPRRGAGRRAGRGRGGPGGARAGRWCASSVATKYDLAEEFVRWEMATAVAGSILGINPFNQPDVEASKIATRDAHRRVREDRARCPPETPFFEGEGVKLFADPANAEALSKARWRRRRRWPGYLRAHLDRLRHGRLLRAAGLRADERGPRGGAAGGAPPRARRGSASPPASASGRASCTRPARPTRAGRTAGCSCRSPATTPQDLPVPGQRYTFGVVKAAQARGDFQVLAERERRALRVHLGPDVAARPRALDAAVEQGSRHTRRQTARCSSG